MLVVWVLPAVALLLWLEAVPDGVRLVLVAGVSALWVAVDLLSLVPEDCVVVVVVPRLRVAVTLWELLPEDDEEAGFVVVCLRVAVVVFLSLALELVLAGLVVVVVVCLRVAVVVFLSGVWEEEMLLDVVARLVLTFELRLGLELLTELRELETLLLLLELLERLFEAELRLEELLERLLETLLLLDELLERVLETLLLLLELLERLLEAELRLVELLERVLEELLPERLVVLVWVEVPRLRVCASAAGLASIVQAKMAEVISADSFIMCRFLLSPR